jgi:translation initiation factor IF-3
MAKQFKKKESIVEPRINNEIRGYQMVRVVYDDPNGEKFNKVLTLDEAKRRAQKLNLDLVEINSKTDPPIVRIVNYSKYLYELKKSMKQKQRKSSETKEVQLSVNISEHDIAVKANKAREFINNGDKVKVVLKMRGRELSRRDLSKKSLFVFVEALSDCAVAENMPKDEGNKCIVYLKKKK